LVTKVPEGVYRELLVERLAEAIRLPATRLNALWGTTGSDDPGSVNRARAGGRTGQSAGRGGLMRQAVQGLVRHPRIATRLDAAHLEALQGLDEPGADILRALVADLRSQPISTTAQLLERWRDRPEADRLARLAATESLVPGEEPALHELQTALERMRDEGARRRLDALLERERDGALGAAERTELTALLAGQKGRRPAT
jgi:DNA primase